MLGAAIGDALGKQNEGLTRDEIIKKGLVRDYGIPTSKSPGYKLKPSQYTDDTEQMIVLACSLIECNGFDVNDFSERIAKWGIETINNPIKRNILGPSSMSSIKKLNSKISWKESGSDIPSCGSSMRVAPIGLFYKNFDDIVSYAALSSIPTHKSKKAIAGAVAVAIGVRCAFLELELSEIIKKSSDMASKFDRKLGKKIMFAFIEKDSSPELIFSKLGTSFLVDETVSSAFYCFSRHFKQPYDAIIEAVNCGGDTDSIACITGALCGAFYGINAFPEKWIDELEDKEILYRIGNKLAEKI